jgi:uncharacterized protein
MRNIPSRFRRLDEILYDLPIDEPMLLTELDGYLTAIATCPEAIAPAEWLPPLWGGVYGESAPFEDPIDAQLFADMVVAHHDEIIRELRRGKPQPIFDVDERNGEVLWEEWIDGFMAAVALRPLGWAAMADSDDEKIVMAFPVLHTLAGIAANDTTLDSMQINELSDEAPRLISEQMAILYAWRVQQIGEPAPPAARPAKVGRNDPCPCGSGKKHKRCCGTN